MTPPKGTFDGDMLREGIGALSEALMETEV
jgi:hypothetical protein